MESRQSQTIRLDSIEALRGLAAIAVVLEHSELMQFIGIFSRPGKPVHDWFGWGALGVDCFFCISGFVITWTHARDIGAPARSQRFLFRRFGRIYPPYLVLVLIKIVEYVIRRDFWNPNLPFTARVLNSVFLLPHGPLILAVSWTLTFEFLFYTAFLFAIVTGRGFVRVVIPLWVAAIFGYCLSNRHATEWQMGDLVFSPFILEFLLGVAAARMAKAGLTVVQALGILAFAVVLIAIGLASHLLGVHSGATLGGQDLWQKLAWGTCFSMLILSLAALDLRRAYPMPRICLLFGAASYSIYLTHQDTFLKVSGLVNRAIAGKSGAFVEVVIFGAVALSIGIGLGYHFVVEKPLVKWVRSRLEPEAPALVALET